MALVFCNEGGRDVDDFLSFIGEKVGTSHDAMRQLTSVAGIVASLDAVVKEFASASDDEKKILLSKIEEKAEKLKGYAAKYRKIYSKVATSCVEKVADYVTK